MRGLIQIDIEVGDENVHQKRPVSCTYEGGNIDVILASMMSHFLARISA